MLTVGADGTLMQKKTPYPDGIRYQSCVDVFVNADATMPWCGRSGESNTDASECRLTEEAAKIVIFACTQFTMAGQTDPQAAYKSMPLHHDILGYILFGSYLNVDKCYADQYGKAINLLYAYSRSLVALEKGIERIGLCLYPDCQELSDFQVNCDWLDLLTADEMKTARRVHVFCYCKSICFYTHANFS